MIAHIDYQGEALALLHILVSFREPFTVFAGSKPGNPFQGLDYIAKLQNITSSHVLQSFHTRRNLLLMTTMLKLAKNEAQPKY